jgi:hypothetical protein
MNGGRRRRGRANSLTTKRAIGASAEKNEFNKERGK